MSTITGNLSVVGSEELALSTGSTGTGTVKGFCGTALLYRQATEAQRRCSRCEAFGTHVPQSGSFCVLSGRSLNFLVGGVQFVPLHFKIMKSGLKEKEEFVQGNRARLLWGVNLSGPNLCASSTLPPASPQRPGCGFVHM